MSNPCCVVVNTFSVLKNKLRIYFIMRLLKRARRIREFKQLVADILENENVCRMHEYIHHGNVSCFEHSMHVAYWNFLFCSFLGWDKVAAARAGMLHDLFLYDWHTYKAGSIKRLHGFVHPRYALENAKKDFELSNLEEDIILKHMFPLTLALPRYKETYIIILTDKICCVSEVIRGFLHTKPFVCRMYKQH